MADGNSQNKQGSQQGSTQGSTQGDDQKLVKFAQVQELEQEAILDENILSSEEELLGLNKSTDKKAAATMEEKESNFHIPQVVRDQYPDLVPLIIQTESMDDEEREYWFQILPIMTEDQVVKLQNILFGEKKQLAKLDAEYEEELAKINEKHLQEWQSFESKQNREELAKKEIAAEQEEADLEAELLSKLADL